MMRERVWACVCLYVCMCMCVNVCVCVHGTRGSQSLISAEAANVCNILVCVVLRAHRDSLG